MLRSVSLLLLLFPFYSFATSLNVNTLNKLLPKGSQFSLIVIDSKTGKTDIKFNENLLLPPASTQKLVTALAASLYLPKNFRFKTDIYTANDDLIIAFSGDPTLKRSELKKLLAKLKSSGIKSIDGNIWFDTSVFAGYDKAIGLPWDTLGVCYTAPASAVTLEENCFHASLYANKDKSTRVYVPPHQPVFVSTLVETVTSEEEKKQHLCDLDLKYTQNNHYHLSGCISTQKNPLPLQFAIQNPEKYAADVIKQLLSELKINLKGQVRYFTRIPSTLQAQKSFVASHFSQPRDVLLVEILKESNNLVADNLLKMLGHMYYNASGTFRNGVSAVKEIVRHKTGISLNQVEMVDGSGLSRDNRMTAAKLAEVLQWIYNNPQQGLLGMLPIAGVDGTLKYRHGVRYKPIRNNLIAKSGSLYGSHNLAGIVKRKDRDLLVVQFVANYFVSREQQERDRENRNNMPIVKFEKALYGSLLKNTKTAKK